MLSAFLIKGAKKYHWPKNESDKVEYLNVHVVAEIVILPTSKFKGRGMCCLKIDL